MCVLSAVIGASFLHALTGGAKVTTTARNGQHIAVEADHAHRGLLERRPYVTLASEIRCDVAIANLHELPLRGMHARVCDLGGRSGDLRVARRLVHGRATRVRGGAN